MSWRDTLRKASFRGVEFWWSDTDLTIDPQVAIHKYPQRRGGWTEDLGLGPDEFALTGYVLGLDYMTARDALIKAIKQGGPGTLVHPTMGEKQVVCTGCSVKETVGENGKAAFSLKFTEEGENTYPEESPVAGALVTDRAGLAEAALAADFSDDWDILGLDALVIDALEALNEAEALVTEAVSAVVWVQSLPGQAQALAARLLALVHAPGNLVKSLLGLLRSRARSGAGRSDTARTLSGLHRLAASVPTTRLPAGAAQQDINRAALAKVVARAAAVESARVATQATYASRDEAVAARDLVAEALDLVRAAPGTRGPVFAALTDLRAAAVKDLGGKAGNLAALRRVEMGDSLPAALVAHREIGDAGRRGELVERNRRIVRHPLFIPSGAVLEVLP